MQLINYLRKVISGIRELLGYRRTILFLLKKRGLKAAYNFLFFKIFVSCGEGALGLAFIFISPLFRLFPRLIARLAPYPFNIEIEITNRCNKKCLICEHTYWHESDRDLKFEEFKRIVDQFPHLKWVNLTGEGDAFLNKDYLKMIDYLKSKDIPVYLVDSFDLVHEKVARELIKMGVDGIWVSIDGATKETYEKIKIGCSFERSLNNIRNLIKLKKEMNSPIPELCFRYIVTTLNVHEIPQFIELVHSLTDSSSSSEGSKVEFAGLLKFKEIEHLFISEIPERILQTTLRKARELNIRVTFAHAAKLPPMKECTAWLEPYIMMGGYVLPCCAVLMANDRPFLREHSFGNVLEKPFKDIWYSERYRRFRRLVSRAEGEVPILCKGCRAYETNDRERKYGVSKEI